MTTVTALQPITIEDLADILETAQSHEHTDHNSTTLHSGTDQAGQPFTAIEASGTYYLAHTVPDILKPFA